MKPRFLFTAAVTILFAACVPEGGRVHADETSVVLTRVEIQILRLVRFKRHPKVLDLLSPVGNETLFGERAKAVDTVVVEGGGSWRWKFPSDVDLSKGEMGLPSDAVILRKTLSCSASTFQIAPRRSGDAGLSLTLDDDTARAVCFYRNISNIWINKGGGTVEMRALYARTLDSAAEIWDSKGLSEDIRNADAALVGDLLRRLPDDFRADLLKDEKVNGIAKQWTDLSKRREGQLLDSLPDAKPADDGPVSHIMLPFIREKHEGAFLFPTPATPVSTRNGLYILHMDPGTKVVMQVMDKASIPEKAFAEVDADKLVDWMKKGKVEIFLDQGNKAQKISPTQLETQINAIQTHVGSKE